MRSGRFACAATEVAAFFQKVSYPHGINDCWVWVGARNHAGYGVFGGGTKRAHRLAYEWFVGVIPDGRQIDHLCRNTSCVNPAHIECVTPEENRARRRAKQCARGHAIVGANAYANSDGRGRTYDRCHICYLRDAAAARKQESAREAVGA